MPFQSKKAKLMLTEEEQKMMQRVSTARTEEYRRVERSRMLLQYAEGSSIPKIAELLNTTVTKVNRFPWIVD
jgi:DNA-directed RNA polymerase specialized sigma24 family protein